MDLVKTLVAYLVARLSEASTWASLTAYLGAQFGLHLNSDLDGPLAQLVVAASALAGVLIREGWQQKSSDRT